ncbi:MAG: hypothetical protein ACREXY_11645, partial [Gammaproteobacteria bacterium]
LEALAFAEGRLLSIHPFLDFNGRATRVWLREVIRRLPPDVFPCSCTTTQLNSAQAISATCQNYAGPVRATSWIRSKSAFKTKPSPSKVQDPMRRTEHEKDFGG